MVSLSPRQYGYSQRHTDVRNKPPNQQQTGGPSYSPLYDARLFVQQTERQTCSRVVVRSLKIQELALLAVLVQGIFKILVLFGNYQWLYITI